MLNFASPFDFDEDKSEKKNEKKPNELKCNEVDIDHFDTSCSFDEESYLWSSDMLETVVEFDGNLSGEKEREATLKKSGKRQATVISKPQLRKRIVSSEVHFAPEAWMGIDSAAKELIRQLLAKDATNRISISAAL